MLERVQRASRDEIINALKKGKRVSNNIATLFFLSNDKQFNKYSFIVSNKILKKAILRNVLKRRARYIMRKYNIEIKKGHNMNFIFKKEVRTLSFKDIEKEMLKLLQTGKLVANIKI